MQKLHYNGLNEDALREVEASQACKHFWIHESVPRHWTYYFCIQYDQEHCLVFYADTELVIGYEECVFLCCEKQFIDKKKAYCTPPQRSYPQDANLPAVWSYLGSETAPLRMELIHDTVVFQIIEANESIAEEWEISANVGLAIHTDEKTWILMTADGAPRMIYLKDISEMEPITETWRYHYDLPEQVSADDPYRIDLVTAKREFLPL